MHCRSSAPRRPTPLPFPVPNYEASGRGGRSPDGTPALHAKLGLGWWSGLAVKGATIYFSDGDLVREVGLSGLLSTVAGGGKAALGQRPVPAWEADMLGGGPYGLTIGSGKELYIATGAGVYRLGSDGRLHWVVGGTSPCLQTGTAFTRTLASRTTLPMPTTSPSTCGATFS